MSFDAQIRDALAAGTTITLKSSTLRDSGEAKLEYIVKSIFSTYQREDLVGPVYASVRELVQNASKANLKRILFEEMNLDPVNEEEYQRGMERFRYTLVEPRMKPYATRIKQKGLFFTVSFTHCPDVMVASVKNIFPLFGAEETRIREKFVHSLNVDNLYEFFMSHSDPSEGAGMGIAMIEILLAQGGVDRHNFTISSDKQGHTVARMVVPLTAGYVSPRQQFQRAMEERGISAPALRAEVQSGAFPLMINAKHRLPI
ncbi:MAG: hypothetical protein HY042_07330 [Spirochaetia bacterium]|nr:hypothetical protein [Spirochaetia bacterium]